MTFPIIVPIILEGAALLGIGRCSRKSGETPSPQGTRSASKPTNSGTSPQPQTNPSSTPAPANALITWTPTLVQNMDRHDSTNWEMANWSNGNPFATTWQPDNITFNNGIMTITLDNAGCPRGCDGKPYASGEYRTRQEVYGYGYYEVRMKGAAGNGLVGGTFFIYRGVYGQPSHDEIDFEILGKDCNAIQTNYYVEGRGGHEQMINLDFNACESFNNYGIKWSADSLIFYVNGKEVRRINEDPATAAHEIPYRPGKIMVNFWPGTSEVNGWLNGPFKYSAPLSVQYDWIKYSPLTTPSK